MLGAHTPAVLANSAAGKRPAGAGSPAAKPVSKKAAREKTKSKAKATAATAVTAVLARPSARATLNSILVQLHQRHVVENPFVSAHCYFEALSHSNPLTAGMPAKTGAKLVRSVYSFAYMESEIRRALMLWVQETHQELNPAYDPEEEFVGTDWHPSWFDDRSELMRTVDG